MPSLEDHEAVVVLDEERHFGRAARRLGISQPALTARLRRLEQSLEARLFDRGRSGVVPTSAGTAFVEGARRVLDAASEAVAAARDARTGFGLTLRIGTTQIAAYQVLPPCLAAFRLNHPMARLRLSEGTSASLERDLEQGSIDVAFLHPPVHAPGLAERTLITTGLAERHLHVDGIGTAPIRYPRDEAPVMMGEIDRTRGIVDARHANGQVEAATAVTALALSMAGYGPAIVPDDFPAFGREATAPQSPLTGVALHTSIAWRSLDRRPAIRALVSAADNAFD